MSKGRLALIAVSVLALAGLVLYAVIRGKSDVINAEAGDCIHVNSDTDFEVVDCSSEQAQYKVLSVVDGLSDQICTLDPDYDSAISITGDTSKTVCLQTWLQVGDCVGSDRSWAECGSSESAYEVIEVLADTQDDAQCPDEATLSRSYVSENNVICLARPS